MVNVSASFSGSIPEFYDKCLGPAWFDVFAADLAQRLPAKPPGDVLEIACGTGVMTGRLRERLDSTVRLTATDLSKAMLDYARGKLSERRDIEWREAMRSNCHSAIVSLAPWCVPSESCSFPTSRRLSGRPTACSSKMEYCYSTSGIASKRTYTP